MTLNQIIAREILNQLGAHRFLAMTGAKNLTALNSGLQFDLPARFAVNGVNRVTIELAPSDTYTVTFFKLNRRNFDSKVIAREELIYCDMLQATFTQHTGLYTTL
jgi:uncharacterized protein YfdQ (DUF2303 family)